MLALTTTMSEDKKMLFCAHGDESAAQSFELN